MIIWTEKEVPAPSFAGLFDSLSEIQESGMPFTVSDGGKRMDINGGTGDSSLLAYFSTGGTAGKFLMIVKLTSVVADPTVTFDMQIGFGRTNSSLTDAGVVFAWERYYVTNTYDYAYLAEQTPPATVVGSLLLKNTTASIVSPVYVAIAYDFAAGTGEIISVNGSTAIEDAEINVGGSGLFGNRLAGENFRALINLNYNASANGTTTTGGQYRIELLKSSASHGLTLPSDYTNIVPEE